MSTPEHTDSEHEEPASPELDPTTKKNSKRAASTASTHSISSSSSEYSYAGSEASVCSDEVPVDAVAARLAEVFDPIVLDRPLAIQAQISGLVNAQSQELTELKTQLDSRLVEVKDLALRGRSAMKQVAADLARLRKRVTAIEARARNRYPMEYVRSKEKIDPHGAL